MKKYFFFFVLLLASIVTQAQDVPSLNGEVKKNGISLGILGTATYAGITYDRIIGSKVNLEVGIGVIGMGAGINYYLSEMTIDKINFYTGIKFTHHGMILDESRSIIYTPIGVTYITKGQISIGVDAGPAIIRRYSDSIIDDIFGNEDEPTNEFGVFGSLKIGIRF